MAVCPVLLPSEKCSVGQHCADLAPPRPDSFWRDHFRELTALATNRFPCVKPQVVGQTECEGRFRPQSIHRKRCMDARFSITLRPRSISDNRSLTKYDTAGNDWRKEAAKVNTDFYFNILVVKGNDEMINKCLAYYLKYV